MRRGAWGGIVELSEYLREKRMILTVMGDIFSLHVYDSFCIRLYKPIEIALILKNSECTILFVIQKKWGIHYRLLTHSIGDNRKIFRNESAGKTKTEAVDSVLERIKESLPKDDSTDFTELKDKLYARLP